MKKQTRKKARSSFMIILLLGVFILIMTFLYKPSIIPQNIYDPYANVKKYQPLIHHDLAKYHLEQYTTVLVALMQQESHGKGGDPMQSSESAGLARNTIKSPIQSVQIGVLHFRSVLLYGEKKKVDFATIIQAYNMGIGYIDYVAAHGGRHSEQLAKDYSLLQVQKNPKIYTCGGDKSNFRYPYCYGDFTYSTKVAKNLEALGESVAVFENQKTTAQSY